MSDESDNESMKESDVDDEEELENLDEDEADEEEDMQTQAERREANVRALISNKLEVQRAPVMTKLNLSIEAVEKTLKRAFVSPLVGAPAASSDLIRRLAARKVFVPWGSNAPLKPLMPSLPFLDAPQAPPAQAIVLPEGIEPLVVWEGAAPQGGSTSVVVDPMLTRWLRPHQREGVSFMFQCVTGQRVEGGQGCILADDMGLGKTLQAIALLWTLLSNGNEALGGSPIAKRAIIVCPTSLVSNWESECEKWLCGRLKCLALCEASRDDVVSSIASFLLPRQPAKVLIISYETFRIHADKLHVPTACDLLICDEAHRLKNDATLTNRALDALPCKRRVLLSGTPLQNDLAEFFAMVDFTNPGILGTAAAFRRNYESPILAGREPDATPEVVERGSNQSAELSSLVNSFILRRTNALLSAHLPPKVGRRAILRNLPLPI